MSSGGKKQEDEWFAHNERELIKTIKIDRERREQEMVEALKAEEAQKLKALHYLKCPKCGSDMKVKEIEGVEVDVCSLCEGIYIDKDEIEHFVMTQKKEPTSFIKKLLGLKK